MKTAFKTLLTILIILTFTGLSFASNNNVSREEFMKVTSQMSKVEGGDPDPLSQTLDI